MHASHATEVIYSKNHFKSVRRDTGRKSVRITFTHMQIHIRMRIHIHITYTHTHKSIDLHACIQIYMCEDVALYP